MTDNTLPKVDVQTKIYMVDGAEIKKEDIPENAEYEIHKLNKEGELQYVEACAQGATQRLGTIARDGKYQAAADAILAHAINTDDSQVNEYIGSIEIGIVLPAEHFDMTVALEEGEQYEVKAILDAAPEDENDLKSPMKATMLGYIVEIFVTEPVLMRTRKIQYTEDRKLYSIDYVLFAIQSDDQVSEQFTFSEYGEEARAEIDEYNKEDGEEDHNYIFPICEQSYLDEVSEYLGVDYVAHGDFQNTPIAQDDIQNHEDFKQQWFNSEQKPSIMQLIFQRGIGYSEILDVPQEKHMHVLHAYLRLMHKYRQRFSTDEVKSSHYIVCLEPISKESTDAVQLEEGQYKRHQSICTREGVVVVAECVVFNADDMPVRKLSFGRPNEIGLMYEEILKFDKDGAPLESEMIQHM